MINLYELWIVILVTQSETFYKCVRAHTFLSEYLTTAW